MSSLASLWPAFLAAAVAAVIQRRAAVKHRLGLSAVSFVLAASVVWLWPSGEPIAAQARPDEWPHVLNVLVMLPIAGGVAVMFLPRQMLSLVRGVTYGVFGLSFLVSLLLLTAPMTAGWHFQYIHEWIPAAGIRYHVAIDGISLWLVLLTTFTTPIAAFASFGSVKTRIKELCVAFLVLQGAMIGAFVALDLFLFYVFWELMLVPMFLMIGIWGGADRIKAAIKFFIYTMAGSMLMLAAMLYLVWTSFKLTGIWSFDYLQLTRVVLPGAPNELSPQTLCFWAFSLAFFIKVPLFPLHTWLPDAHVQAPTGGSVVLAAVMLKLGTYAYMRFSMGLFPAAAHAMSATLAGVAIMGGIVYGALCAWKQSDIKRLVAYSSVAHLGFVMLGLFGAHPSGMKGAVLQMINHGIATGALFMLVGVLYDRRHTREVSAFGGLAKVMPVYAVLFIIVTMASIGVPGTNGFVGEFLIIAATYNSQLLSAFSGVQTVGAAFGVILAAVYMLSVVQKTFFGPLDKPENRGLTDISPRETVAVAPLIAMIFIIGLFPSIFLSRMDDSIRVFHAQFNEVVNATKGPQRVARRLPATGLFHPAFLKGAPEIPEPGEAGEQPSDEAGGEEARRQAPDAAGRLTALTGAER